MRLVRLLILCWIFACASAHADCFSDAGDRYGVDHILLRAMAKVESNYNPDAIHYDADGTRDVGILQINSSHFDDLFKRYNITEKDLHNACTNISVSASILADFINKFGFTWRAVGSYCAGKSREKRYEDAKKAYVAKVKAAYNAILVKNNLQPLPIVEARFIPKTSRSRMQVIE